MISDQGGVLLVDKEKGMTSHDVVDLARNSLKIKKIGHCGTLDPMATGLLVLVIGRATKFQRFLMSDDKQYRGSIFLGVETDTYDKEGNIVEERELSPFSREDIDNIFSSFIGEFPQIPPMFSAVKNKGIPLYKLARKGKEIKREPRLVRITNYQIHKISLQRIEFTISCSKGFYVRSFAHNVGKILKCGGCLDSLSRLRSGVFNLESAISLKDLRENFFSDSCFFPSEEVEKLCSSYDF